MMGFNFKEESKLGAVFINSDLRDAEIHDYGWLGRRWRILRTWKQQFGGRKRGRKVVEVQKVSGVIFPQYQRKRQEAEVQITAKSVEVVFGSDGIRNEDTTGTLDHLDHLDLE